MSKKVLALVTAAVLVISLFSGCSAGKKADSGGKNDTVSQSGTDTNFNKTGLPIVKEKVTLKVAAPKSANAAYSDMVFYNELEQKTNVHIDFEEIEGNAWKEKLQLLLASSQMPEAVYGMTNDSNLIQNYGRQGIIVPLEKLIDQYSVNVKKVLKQRPELEKAIKYLDGHIYTLPTIAEFLYMKTADSLFVNNEWLQRTGQKLPTTTDEFYNLMKVFKENDGNGNGKKDDICFSFTRNINNIPNPNSTIDSLFGSFGVLDNPQHVMVKNKKLIYVPIQDGYRQGLEYFNKLYREGLMDIESFTQDGKQLYAKADSPEGIGATVAFSAGGIVGSADYAKDEVQRNKYKLVLPLKGPGGTQLWNDWQEPCGIQADRFFITNSNKHPEVTMRWIDFLLDDDVNSLTSRNGKEGLSWKRDSNGKWETMPVTPNTPQAEEASKYSAGSLVPWFWTKEIAQKRILDSDIYTLSKQKEYEAYAPFLNKEPLPSQMKYEPMEAKELAGITTDLNKYVEEMAGKFITSGVTDQQWQEYVKKVQSYNVERLLSLMQKSYDTYTK